MTPAKANAELTFEQALARLDEIVATLERGDPSLEEALALFEEGIKLKEHCTRLLERAADRIRVLTEGLDDRPDEQDLALPELRNEDSEGDEAD